MALMKLRKVEHQADESSSGLVPFGFPLVDGVLIEFVAAVFALFVGATLFLLLAFFAAIAHDRFSWFRWGPVWNALRV